MKGGRGEAQEKSFSSMLCHTVHTLQYERERENRFPFLPLQLLDVTTAHTYEAEYHFPQGVSPRGVTLPESVTARETFAAEVTLKEDAGYLVGVTQDLKLTGEQKSMHAKSTSS